MLLKNRRFVFSLVKYIQIAFIHFRVYVSDVPPLRCVQTIHTFVYIIKMNLSKLEIAS